jgi:hypothetical protein
VQLRAASIFLRRKKYVLKKIKNVLAFTAKINCEAATQTDTNPTHRFEYVSTNAVSDWSRAQQAIQFFKMAAFSENNKGLCFK